MVEQRMQTESSSRIESLRSELRKRGLIFDGKTFPLPLVFMGSGGLNFIRDAVIYAIDGRIKEAVASGVVGGVLEILPAAEIGRFVKHISSGEKIQTTMVDHTNANHKRTNPPRV